MNLGCDPVIVAARNAFASAARQGRERGSAVRPLQIVKMWRSTVQALDENCFLGGVLVAPNLKVSQMIDLVDARTSTAYSFKVVGRDADGELYRDIVKIIFWNQTREPKIKRLIFITEGTWGRKYLDTPVVRGFTELHPSMDLEVSIEVRGQWLGRRVAPRKLLQSYPPHTSNT